MNSISIKGIKIKLVAVKKLERKGVCELFLEKADEKSLRTEIAKAIKRAWKKKKKEVAFALIGGPGYFPFGQAGKIIAQEIYRYIYEYKEHRTRQFVIFCSENEHFEDVRKGLIGYLNYFTNEQRSPFLTADCIIKVKTGVVVIERSNPPLGFALPGGFVDYGESLEEAVRREMKEETGLDLKNLEQYHTYSEPGRDPRFHVVTTVFTASSTGTPVAGDDAKSVRVITKKDMKGMKFAADHREILNGYFKRYR